MTFLQQVEKADALRIGDDVYLKTSQTPPEFMPLGGCPKLSDFDNTDVTQVGPSLWETIDRASNTPTLVECLTLEPVSPYNPEIQAIMDKDIHDAHPEYTRADWEGEAFVGDTQRGYWDWVQARVEEAQADE